jgi:hypothetical protein
VSGSLTEKHLLSLDGLYTIIKSIGSICATNNRSLIESNRQQQQQQQQQLDQQTQPSLKSRTFTHRQAAELLAYHIDVSEGNESE